MWYLEWRDPTQDRNPLYIGSYKFWQEIPLHYSGFSKEKFSLNMAGLLLYTLQEWLNYLAGRKQSWSTFISCQKLSKALNKRHLRFPYLSFSALEERKQWLVEMFCSTDFPVDSVFLGLAWRAERLSSLVGSHTKPFTLYVCLSFQNKAQTCGE